MTVPDLALNDFIFEFAMFFNDQIVEEFDLKYLNASSLKKWSVNLE